MIPHDGLIAKHMLHDIGHEKTFGKPEPYEYVEHRAEQSRERRGQVGNGSGPEPERRQDRDLVPRLCLTRAFSHDHGRTSPSGGRHAGLLVYCIFYIVNEISDWPASPMPRL